MWRAVIDNSCLSSECLPNPPLQPCCHPLTEIEGIEGKVRGKEVWRTRGAQKYKGETSRDKEKCKEWRRRESGRKRPRENEREGKTLREWGRQPLVLISRNAELGDVSDFGGQTPPGARRGHVCFSARRLKGSDFTRDVWLFSC